MCNWIRVSAEFMSFNVTATSLSVQYRRLTQTHLTCDIRHGTTVVVIINTFGR